MSTLNLAKATTHAEIVQALQERLAVHYVFSSELSDKSLHIRASACMIRHPPGSADKPIPLELTICLHTADMGVPLVIDDAESHPLVQGSPALDALGVAAYLGVPVFRDQGQLPRTIAALHMQRRHWLQSDVRLMQDAARLSASLPYQS